MIEKKPVQKIVVAGDGGVGKTTLVNKLIKKDEDVKMTTGISFESMPLDLGDNMKADIIFYDLGGQKQFRCFQDDFFDCAKIVLLVFDLNRFPSFHNIETEWLPFAKRNNGETSSIQILVGNKIDLGQSIDEQFIEEFANENEMPFIKISAKESTNLERLKEVIIEQLKKCREN